MTVREISEISEENNLCEYACLSKNSKGRQKHDEKCSMRTDFQRDRDRIVHCNSFRRLKQKTQVYLIPSGDHYRTRLTHTFEVSQIARTIARGLRLNEDLVEAISLGHDLGHTPFGHAGEAVLNDISSCGFKHYEQSVRVVEYIEKNGEGLNLTHEVREGILAHTNKISETKEGYVVRLADRIAYINHDIDDSVVAGIITENDIPKHIKEVLGNSKSTRITTCVSSIIENGPQNILMSDEIKKAHDELHEWMFANVYRNPLAKSEEVKAKVLVEMLFDFFMKNPDKLPKNYLDLRDRFGVERAVLDYIAGMTDNYAIKIFEDIFVPKSFDK